MPICIDCGSSFKNRIWIDGKKHHLSKRKRCLECSPFGSPRKTSVKNAESNRTCEVCSREYIYSHKKGHTEKLCNSCSVNIRRFLRKKKMLEYKGNKCFRCGYDKSSRALEFHHRDKEEKIFDISGCHSLAWNRIQVELDKCDLVCSNCHRELEEIEDAKNHISKEEIINKYFKSRVRFFTSSVTE